MSRNLIFNSTISEYGRSKHRSGLIPKYLDHGTCIYCFNINNCSLLAEINPYHSDNTISRIISEVSNKLLVLEKAIIENDYLLMESLILSCDINSKSTISQLFFSGVSLLHNKNIVDIYTEYFNQSPPLGSLKYYASGGTLISFTDISQLKHEIDRAIECGLKYFKFRPPVGSQLSHEDRLKLPPKVSKASVESITSSLGSYFDGLMVDFGCRLTPNDIKIDNSILQKYEFIEEPIKRQEEFDFHSCRNLRIAGGEFCRDYSEFKAYCKRHSGLSYFQPDANLISAYDLKKILLNRDQIDFAMHNWTTPVAAIHNIAIGTVLNARYIEWPVVDNPFYGLESFGTQSTHWLSDINHFFEIFRSSIFASKSLSVEEFSIDI